VSYGYATKMIEEIKELTAKAESADSTPLAEGLTIPKELARREERRAKLHAAKKLIEERKKCAKQAREAAKAEKPGKSVGKENR
jgi:hypothetical protein